MRYLPDSLRQLIIDRANNRCEYRGLSQVGQAATFYIDHVVPMAVGGETIENNLALACVSCSLRKGAKQLAIEPGTDHYVPIFDPREWAWTDHFEWHGSIVVGITDVGRATVKALDLNRSMMLTIRDEERFFDRHPPPE